MSPWWYPPAFFLVDQSVDRGAKGAVPTAAVIFKMPAGRTDYAAGRGIFRPGRCRLAYFFPLSGDGPCDLPAINTRSVRVETHFVETAARIKSVHLPGLPFTDKLCPQFCLCPGAFRLRPRKCQLKTFILSHTSSSSLLRHPLGAALKFPCQILHPLILSETKHHPGNFPYLVQAGTGINHQGRPVQ